MFYGHAGMGVGWMVLLLLLLVVLFATVAAAVVLAVTRGGRRASAPWGGAGRPAEVSSRAHAILDERLARGEIDETEYRSRRAALDDRGA